jgi:hypothetical protein
MDDATRVVPEPGETARYRDLQAIFDQAARDLAGTFSLHRRFLGSGLRHSLFRVDHEKAVS